LHTIVRRIDSILVPSLNLREELEPLASRQIDSEVTSIQGEDRGQVSAFGQLHERYVGQLRPEAATGHAARNESR
jgi:hypothetical protein